VKGVIFAAGDLRSTPLEFISGLAAMQMESLIAPAPMKREDLISIDRAAPGGGVKPRANWADLSSEDQALHLRAQRAARMRAAQMRLENSEAFQRGIDRGDIYGALREPIDRAREEFQRDYLRASPTMVDYLYIELVRGLASDNERLLGPGFPGPLVSG
jgi:hypothetical protein